ncbi:unnamed protein product [Amoebophrya sp. A25]|nr:unnamed protein product [Amoebophrya sp. A25]|eukprot:GSA25T00004511001.1
MSLPSAASVRLALKSLKKFHNGQTGRGRDRKRCLTDVAVSDIKIQASKADEKTENTNRNKAAEDKDHAEADTEEHEEVIRICRRSSSRAREDSLVDVDCTMDEVLDVEVESKEETSIASNARARRVEHEGEDLPLRRNRLASDSCDETRDQSSAANETSLSPSATRKIRARPPPLPLQEQRMIEFPREFSNRFASALRRMMRLGPDDSLERWHDTIENFDPSRSVRGAKRDLGFLLRQAERRGGTRTRTEEEREEEKIPEQGHDVAVSGGHGQHVCGGNVAGLSSPASTASTAAGEVDAESCESFQDVYHDFLRKVIFPHLRAEWRQGEEEDKGSLFEPNRPTSSTSCGSSLGYLLEGASTCSQMLNAECSASTTSSSSASSASFFVQTSPCIRLQPPSTQRLTLPHTDAMYGHQPGQINFWLPLNETDGAVCGSNSLYAETFPGRKDFRSFDLNRGQAMRFYGNQCLHFTEPNKTQFTRVSLDFRVVPGWCFELDWWGGCDPKGRPKFRVGDGEYYTELKLLESSTS